MGDQLEFVRIVSALRKLARRKGKREVANALDQCLLKTTGGGSECPIGALLFSGFLEKGVVPGEAMNEEPQLPGIDLTHLPENRTEFIDQVLHPIAVDGLSDEALTAALEKCAYAVEENEQCPLYVLFQKSPEV